MDDKAYQKAYREKNKEKQKAYSAQWYLKNKEELAKKHREYYDTNLEELTQYHKDYYQQNKEIIMEKQKVYNEQNKEKMNNYQREWYKRNKETILSKIKIKYNQKKMIKDFQDKITIKECEPVCSKYTVRYEVYFEDKFIGNRAYETKQTRERIIIDSMDFISNYLKEKNKIKYFGEDD